MASTQSGIGNSRFTSSSVMMMVTSYFLLSWNRGLNQASA
jgi:hypothetical protein